jgi:CRISPR-associated protein Cas1
MGATLYVTEQGATVGKDGHRIVVRRGKETLQAFPVAQVEQIALFGHVSVTPAALSYCLARNIDTVLLSAAGRYRGRLVGPEGKNILLRRLQFRKYEDEAFRLRFVRTLVSAKIHNMRALLQRTSRRRLLDLSGTVHRLKVLKDQTRSIDAIDRLRGIEGAATAAYFEAFGGLLAPEWPFGGRSRRPPKDAVNALLSFGYTLLAVSVEAAVYTTGLDPYLGMFHVVDYGRPSLALDLMEEFRPLLVDSLVLNVVNHGHLKPEEDFEKRGQGVFLRPESRARYIGAYQERLDTEILCPLGDGAVQRLTYRRCLEVQCRKFIHWMKGECDAYLPVLTR